MVTTFERFSDSNALVEMELEPKAIAPVVLLKPEPANEKLALLEKPVEKLVKEKDPRFLGIKASRWTGATLGIAAIDLILRDPILVSIGIMGGLTKVAYPHLSKGGGKKWKLQLATAFSAAFVAGLGLHLHISAAQALFFQEAENFLAQTFDLSGEAVATIFNVFRAAYVIYLIYSAISIWTAYNRDEDWMSVAKAPIVIFIGGTMIDAVTTIITA